MTKTERFGIALSKAGQQALLDVSKREHRSASARVGRLICYEFKDSAGKLAGTAATTTNGESVKITFSHPQHIATGQTVERREAVSHG